MKTIVVKISFFLMTLSASMVSFAQVNVREGSYRYTPSLNPLSEMGLQYNSRSAYRGIFGFGWCSYLDIKIRVFASQIYQYDHCGRLQTVMPAIKENGLVLVSPENKLLEFTFNQEGEVTRIRNTSNQYELSINRSEKARLIIRLQSQDTEKSWTVFLKAEDRFVDSIEDSSHRIRLVHQKDDLIKILAGDSSRTEFLYDEFHNMIRADADGKSKSVNYDNHDRVMSIEEQNCTEFFQYLNEPATSSQKIQSSKNCGATTIHTATYELFYEARSPRGPAQERSLFKYRVSQGQTVTEITYSPSGEIKTFKVSR